ncbi:MAG: hypothetical protein H0X24_22830 [Ktedonobacterales bacterium]|nr:hypothetical protein [Ktedonobacterales bacterium]
MNRALRFRILTLQIVALLVLGSAAGAAFFAHSFTTGEIHDQLAPQEINFPASAAQGLPSNLNAYAGQQVLNGDQAHAYAEHFIGLHLSEIGKGHPYSYWSGLALSTQDPATKAQAQGIADTLFKGTTLRSLLNEAYAFSVFGTIAFYAGIGLAIAALVALLALVYEIVVAQRKTTAPVMQAAPAMAGIGN